jgi:hypothetical protein
MIKNGICDSSSVACIGFDLGDSSFLCEIGMILGSIGAC